MQASRGLAAEREAAEIDAPDPAFDVHVSPATIGRACASFDAALLTDVALQLAEGERVLLRTRTGITAAQALKLAAKAAGTQHDNTSLERLAKFATLRNDTNLATQVAAAQKLAGTIRGTTVRLRVPIEEIDVDEYTRIRYCVQRMKRSPRTFVRFHVDCIASNSESHPYV